ncbi:MAG: hypothetical protein GY788_03560 [bacterium]|nr:hypothetical protein [bacterium]
MELYFSQYFKVKSETLTTYGAFDISLVSDLPLFVDPFLLFHSKKPKYQALHEDITRYLVFLRDKADTGLSPGLISSWYRFKEVKQNWLGFTLLGNAGSGLGPDFARRLHGALGGVLADFGEEEVTEGSHLEKLGLIGGGVGRDRISDFTTNLIKGYLLRYTEEFARNHLDEGFCRNFPIRRARFNYETEAWEMGRFYLPELDGDFVLLSPVDILTRDDTWISHRDMLDSFEQLPVALPDEELRAQINNYFWSHLSRKPSSKERREAAQKTITRFPALIDYYIKKKEESGDKARSVSADKVDDTDRILVKQLQQLLSDLQSRTDFYDKSWTSYDETLERVHTFKHYVENQDGYRLINRAGQPFSNEKEVQLFFGLLWCGNDFDVNREPNNGRGPVDFKVSYGSGDKSLIEFKLASNTQLKRNLQRQVEIYEKANQTRQSVKVIVFYTAAQQRRVMKILKELGLQDETSIILIDARSANKPSASKA